MQALPRSLIILYYLATIAFMLLDLFAGINVRVAFLDDEAGWRAAYYGFCMACLAGMLWKPQWTTALGTLESLVTLIGLIMNLALRSMLATGDIMESGAGPVTIEEIINFLMSGFIAYFSWSRGMRQLFGPRQY